MTMIKDYYGYFQFSKKQLDARTVSESKIGKKYIPGQVIVKGKQKLYTEITKTIVSNYDDAKIVTQGLLSELSFTEPYSD